MTEQPTEVETPAPPPPVTWLVSEHKTLESCIQYLGKEKWVCWTDPPVKIGDVFVSRMGRFVVTAAQPGVEPPVPPVPPQYDVVAKPEIPSTPTERTPRL
jgi:hypothetical protein